MEIRPVARLGLLVLLVTLVSGCSFDAGTMDLRTVERATSPNDALACPPGVCRAKSDFDSPVFALADKALLDRARTVIMGEPRTELVGADPALPQLVFVQRSKVFGFPDTIWVQGIGVGGRGSVIVYSRSNYGYSDLGVNRERVRDWLAKLERAVREDADPKAR